MSALSNLYRWKESEWIKKSTENLKFIGKGNFGDVFSFYEERTKSQKALKVIEYQRYRIVSNDVEISTKDWFNEARIEIDILRKLGEYQHVLYLDDYHLDHYFDSIYLVTELAEMNLLEYLKKFGNNLPNDKVKRIIDSVLLGLQYAHSKGIVHRDIKPTNILVRKNESLMISDWGIARIFKKSGTKTHITSIKGTVCYLPPDVLGVTSPETRVNLEKGDAYSAGLVFLVCCGCTEGDLDDIRKRNQKKHDDDIVELLEEFVKPKKIPKLEELIRKLTYFDAEERFDIERAVNYWLEPQILIEEKKVRKKII